MRATRSMMRAAVAESAFSACLVQPLRLAEPIFAIVVRRRERVADLDVFGPRRRRRLEVRARLIALAEIEQRDAELALDLRLARRLGA